MENTISKTKNILLVLPNNEQKSDELHYLTENFCGVVVNNFAEIRGEISQKRIYVCGNIEKLEAKNTPFYVIRELSVHYENCDNENIQVIPLGKVPVTIHNAGVYFRDFFDGEDYFNQIKNAHEFQDLTESTKQEKAFRKGIYLTEISQEITAEQNEMLHYRLLRCSSNLSGPTDNFRDVDSKIMEAINEAANSVFEEETTLNHVLAQIYENKKKVGIDAKENGESKAKIKAHSDKTKDMPQNALIAFCTFYDKTNFQHLKPSKTDRYDWCYKEISGLTRLHFKLKNTVSDETLTKEFSVILYPNSVFFIPLSTNRLYTHEIKPSMLNIDKIPTRMGYVARCSKAEAIFVNGQTYLKENGEFIKLEEVTPDTLTDLKDTYREENATEKKVKYGKVYFSMNWGDYQKPIL